MVKNQSIAAYDPRGMLGNGVTFATSPIGVRVLTAEREFNRKAGFTNKDDRPPKFFYEEPLPPHNKVFSISDEELQGTSDIFECRQQARKC